MAFKPPDLQQLMADPDLLAAWLADIAQAVRDFTGVENVLIKSLQLPKATARRSLVGTVTDFLAGALKAPEPTRRIGDAALSAEESSSLPVLKQDGARLSPAVRRRQLSEGFARMGVSGVVHVRNYPSASVPKVKVRVDACRTHACHTHGLALQLDGGICIRALVHCDA